MIAGHINYGPRLFCFLPKRHLYQPHSDPLNGHTETDPRESDTDTESEECGESTLDRSKRESSGDCEAETASRDTTGTESKADEATSGAVSSEPLAMKS
ncbi:hypothetical protein GCK32_020624 [Trichostrongylus colubriformis]|uniref:Uncharacterized protein n=1 Tax=Trichostrongylus colubriformis TaxID=6319 RepID=A0AAN8IBX4_TRICO